MLSKARQVGSPISPLSLRQRFQNSSFGQVEIRRHGIAGLGNSPLLEQPKYIGVHVHERLVKLLWIAEQSQTEAQLCGSALKELAQPSAVRHVDYCRMESHVRGTDAAPIRTLS